MRGIRGHERAQGPPAVPESKGHWCRASSPALFDAALASDARWASSWQVICIERRNGQQQVGKGGNLFLELGPFAVRDDNGGRSAVLCDCGRLTIFRSFDHRG